MSDRRTRKYVVHRGKRFYRTHALDEEWCIRAGDSNISIGPYGDSRWWLVRSRMSIKNYWEIVWPEPSVFLETKSLAMDVAILLLTMLDTKPVPNLGEIVEQLVMQGDGHER